MTRARWLAGTSEHRDGGLRAIVCLLALLSVAPLLARVYGLGPFAGGFVLVDPEAGL